MLKNFKKTHKTHSKFLCEFRIVPLIIVILLANTGCVGLGIATVTTAGIVYSQERSSGRAVTDTKIRVELNAAVVTYSEKLYHSIKLAVVEGRVLITGTIPSRKERNILIDIIRYTEGVEEVIDHLKIGSKSVFSIEDFIISKQIIAAILTAGDVLFINYTFIVHDRIVYSMGISQDMDELIRVTDIVRNIKGVTNVVSYIMIKNDPMRFIYGKQASRQIKMRNSLSIKVATEGNLSSILTL